MNTMDRRAFLKATAAFGALALTGCGGSNNSGDDAPAEGPIATDYTLVKEGTLIVASDLDFIPFDYYEDGVAKGYGVELSQAIAERLGLVCEYLPPQDFDSIIPMIKQGGKADIGNSAFTITDERKEEIDFSDPYFDSNLGVAVRSDSEAKTEEALNDPNITVAVQAGTSGEAWARENLPNATIVPLASPTVCMTGVSTGQYDAFCSDLPNIGYQCTTSFTDCEIAIEIPTGEQYGIVVSKDNPGLLAAINEALADIKADGTLDALNAKWFGI
ncbi:MAG: amino acid ABC transporter substrate-binding protein [Atopobiaceae bacterium]|nr:amino acid ABC transporter substrate-binding protein [Atopobiaceae bacterium]